MHDINPLRPPKKNKGPNYLKGSHFYALGPILGSERTTQQYQNKVCTILGLLGQEGYQKATKSRSKQSNHKG